MLAQIFILALLLSFEVHRAVVMKVLNEAHVPHNLSLEKLQDMVGAVLISNTIIFSEDELPSEGTGHTNALHLSMKTYGALVGRVLIDNGSAINVCPLATLGRIGVDSNALLHSRITIRAFDGSRRETLGRVEILVEIGPVTFLIPFKCWTFHNFLLGHPWIHSSGSVPSSLHQKVKFIAEGHLVTVQAEDEFMIYQAPIVPNIDDVIPIEPSTFQSFELVSAIHVPEGKALFKACYSDIGRMIMRCFRDGGYTPGGGLGKSYQGRTMPVSLACCRAPKNDPGNPLGSRDYLWMAIHATIGYMGLIS